MTSKEEYIKTQQGSCEKEVYNIIECKDGKSRWVKIGCAFVNRDGSINVFLDSFPKDGKLQIRDKVRKQSPLATCKTVLESLDVGGEQSKAFASEINLLKETVKTAQ